MSLIGAVRDEQSRRIRSRRRAEILSCALAVFGELGYRRASVDEILRRAQLRSTTFYDLFPDKEAVFLALVAGSAASLVEELESRCEGFHLFEELVEGLCRTYFEFIAGSDVMSTLMRRDCEKVRSLIDESLVRAALDRLEEDIARSIEASGLPPVDTSYLAGTIIGVTFEVGIRLLDREPYDVEGATRFATAIIVGGCRGLAGRTP